MYDMSTEEGMLALWVEAGQSRMILRHGLLYPIWGAIAITTQDRFTGAWAVAPFSRLWQ